MGLRLLTWIICGLDTLAAGAAGYAGLLGQPDPQTHLLDVAFGVAGLLLWAITVPPALLLRKRPKRAMAFACGFPAVALAFFAAAFVVMFL